MLALKHDQKYSPLWPVLPFILFSFRVYIKNFVTASCAHSVLAALCPEPPLRLSCLSRAEREAVPAQTAVLIEGVKSSSHQTDIMLFPQLL